jgi:hypothetical protein
MRSWLPTFSSRHLSPALIGTALFLVAMAAVHLFFLLSLVSPFRSVSEAGDASKTTAITLDRVRRVSVADVGQSDLRNGGKVSSHPISGGVPPSAAVKGQSQKQLVLPRKSLPPPLPVPSASQRLSVEEYENQYLRYTVRINSWKRPEQLRLSLEHLARCGSRDGNGGGLIAEIQVVWCTAQGPPPPWLLELERETHTIDSDGTNSTATRRLLFLQPPRITVELHDVNSLNERFRIVSPVQTAAVLSIDDDVLRPCVAMDAGFLKWTQQPHRLVGFDARTIVVVDEQQPNETDSPPKLKYGYLSTTEKTNSYSLTLSRFAFVHRHYLRTYFEDMPQGIRTVIDENFNCEDIALSLWVSYQTGNLPPLLADYWALKTLVKLYSSNAISGTDNHKSIRDSCITSFVSQLGLSVADLSSKFVHYPEGSHHNQNWFDCGAPIATSIYGEYAIDPKPDSSPSPSRLLRQVQETVERWRQGSVSRMKRELNHLVRTMIMSGPYDAGYIKNTNPWRLKYHKSEKRRH